MSRRVLPEQNYQRAARKELQFLDFLRVVDDAQVCFFTLYELPTAQVIREPVVFDFSVLKYDVIVVSTKYVSAGDWTNFHGVIIALMRPGRVSPLFPETNLLHGDCRNLDQVPIAVRDRHWLSSPPTDP